MWRSSTFNHQYLRALLRSRLYTFTTFYEAVDFNNKHVVDCHSYPFAICFHSKTLAQMFLIFKLSLSHQLKLILECFCEILDVLLFKAALP